MGWTVWESNPSGGKIFCTCPDRPWGPPSLLYNGYRVFPRGSKRLGHDTDPSTPSSTEVWKQSRAIPVLSIRAFVACKKGETYLHYTYLHTFFHCSILLTVCCTQSLTQTHIQYFSTSLWLYCHWFHFTNISSTFTIIHCLRHTRQTRTQHFGVGSAFVSMWLFIIILRDMFILFFDMSALVMTAMTEPVTFWALKLVH
jgi:hypothetical protein